uniref:Pentatricopeptide repeat-containing protein n=1 Tax=Solanum lycopersicum TaxID=4081 RepID=A0A3Q7GS61_SOLLC
MNRCGEMRPMISLSRCMRRLLCCFGRQSSSCVHVDVILFTSPVDMYAKCGDSEVAFCIFESIPARNLIIGGYANMGLQVFDRMLKSGIRSGGIARIM